VGVHEALAPHEPILLRSVSSPKRLLIRGWHRRSGTEQQKKGLAISAVRSLNKRKGERKGTGHSSHLFGCPKWIFFSPVWQTGFWWALWPLLWAVPLAMPKVFATGLFFTPG